MPKSCLVAFCKNRGKLPGIHYFSITDDRRQSWLQAIGRHPDEETSVNAVICSDHFRQEDILKSGRLKEDVVPSLKLKPEKPSFRIRLDRRFSKEEELNLQAVSVMEVLQLPEEGKPSTSYQPVVVSDDVSDIVCLASTSSNDERQMPPPGNGSKRKRREAHTSSSDSVGLKGSPKKRRRIARMEHSYYYSPRKMKTAITDTAVVKSQLVTKLRKSKQRIAQLRRKVKNLSSLVSHLNNKKFINEEAKSVLEKSFSGVPAALLTRMFENVHRKKPMKKKFDVELKSFAMTLSFYSTKAYEYVRNIFNLTLPSLSTIRSWMTNVNCLPGFSQTSLDLLHIKVTENAEKNRLTICSVMLDEMAIKKQIEFVAGKAWGYIDLGSSITDDNLECATEALVLMVVAVDGNWKLQFGYFLIHSLTGANKANIVHQALVQLQDIGIKVISVTCDGPNVNFAMMNNLGADVNDIMNLKPYFLHPTAYHKIFVILDACHILKLLRNLWGILMTLLDKNNGLIDFNLILKLHEIQEKEGLRFGNKLSKPHIEWQRQKMKVNLAAQTLSSSVADSLEFLQKKIHTKIL